MDFQEFPKMARLSRECVITEKIDGTNAQVLLYATHKHYNGEFLPCILHQYEPFNELGDRLVLLAGSRTQWLTPEKDNYGFAKWVQRNANDLINLGEGRHFGEWWGNGIGRGYGLKEKRFSLFNSLRWVDQHTYDTEDCPAFKLAEKQEFAASCCHVVPILYRGIFDTTQVALALEGLKVNGSMAARNFMRPEGVVVYHIAGNVGFKKTIENDEKPKSLTK